MIDDFEVGWTKSWGVADADSGVPTTDETLYQVLDGQPPSSLRAVPLVRPARAGYQCSGGGIEVQQLALTDTVGIPCANHGRMGP